MNVSLSNHVTVPKSTILDLGCGRNKIPGAFGVDRDPASDADLVADLDVLPLPLPSGHFTRIVCRHVVEHVGDIPRLFEEIHRLAAPGARIEILTPHFSNRCSYTDPTHRHHLGVQFIDWFADRPARRRHPTRWHVFSHFLFEHRFDYSPIHSPARFELIAREITFPRIFRWIGVSWLANQFVNFWEFYLAFIFPARDMRLVLAARKETGDGA